MRRPMALRTLLVLALGVLPAAAATATMPFEEVRTGMTGVGRTVFRGSTVEEFAVEVVGTLPNIGPDRNLILARCTGGPLAETGVFAGMSGSPVFVDGRLVGAVAYAWGFSKDAIAGITPIDEMLAVAERGVGPRPRQGGGGLDPRDLLRLSSAERATRFLERLIEDRFAPRAGLQPMPLPLGIGGLDPGGFARAAERLQRAGLRPVQAPSAGASPDAPPPLQPGSAVGLKLVRGDIDFTATGTVTWVEGDRVLAFGHPMFGLGPVDLPMTGARVETLLANLQVSSRVARPLGEIGAIRQDRASGILGSLGAEPAMLPVRLHFTDQSGTQHRYAFDVARDPLLSPLLLYVSLGGVLDSRERSFGSATLRLREGSVIKLQGEADVELDNLYAGPTSFDYSTGLVAYVLYLLLNNDWQPPQVTGVNLLLDFEEIPRTARIQRVTLDRYRVRAGDSVRASILIDPYRGPEQVVTREIRIPADAPTGPLTLAFGGAMSVSRVEREAEPVFPRSLAELVFLVNNLRRNDRIYVVAFAEDTGVFLRGARMPNLPPSIATLLTRPRTRGNFANVDRRGVLDEAIPTEWAVTGLARIQLEVQPR